jgi:hypothetical protein
MFDAGRVREYGHNNYLTRNWRGFFSQRAGCDIKNQSANRNKYSKADAKGIFFVVAHYMALCICVGFAQLITNTFPIIEWFQESKQAILYCTSVEPRFGRYTTQRNVSVDNSKLRRSDIFGRCRSYGAGGSYGMVDYKYAAPTVLGVIAKCAQFRGAAGVRRVYRRFRADERLRSFVNDSCGRKRQRAGALQDASRFS